MIGIGVTSLSSGRRWERAKVVLGVSLRSRKLVVEVGGRTMLLRLGRGLPLRVNLIAGEVNWWWVILRLMFHVLLSKNTVTIPRFISIWVWTPRWILRLSVRGALRIWWIGRLK